MWFCAVRRLFCVTDCWNRFFSERYGSVALNHVPRSFPVGVMAADLGSSSRTTSSSLCCAQTQEKVADERTTCAPHVAVFRKCAFSSFVLRCLLCAVDSLLRYVGYVLESAVGASNSFQHVVRSWV